jgi:hypothetical protein
MLEEKKSQAGAPRAGGKHTMEVRDAGDLALVPADER